MIRNEILWDHLKFILFNLKVYSHSVMQAGNVKICKNQNLFGEEELCDFFIYLCLLITKFSCELTPWLITYTFCVLARVNCKTKCTVLCWSQPLLYIIVFVTCCMYINVQTILPHSFSMWAYNTVYHRDLQQQHSLTHQFWNKLLIEV